MSYDESPVMLKSRIARRGLLKAAAVAALPLQPQEGEHRVKATPPGSIVDVGSLRVGHYTDTRRPTGCTVVIFERVLWLAWMFVAQLREAAKPTYSIH